MTKESGFEISTYGPLDAARARKSLSQLKSDGNWLYWLESRPEEAGRCCLVRENLGGQREEVFDTRANIRSNVHGYGGGAYCLCPRDDHGPVIGYVDAKDQRIWISITETPGKKREPVALSPLGSNGEKWRHGDLAFTHRGRWILCIRESESNPVRNTSFMPGTNTSIIRREIVAYSVNEPHQVIVLVSGNDFYAAPRVDAVSEKISWIQWTHPNMQWDDSELWLANIQDGSLAFGLINHRCLVRRDPASKKKVSVGQPLFGLDANLSYVADTDGWWEPRVWKEGEVTRVDTSMDYHGADWVLGQQTMAWWNKTVLVARRHGPTHDEIVGIDITEPIPKLIEQPCTSISSLCKHDGGIAFLGSTPTEPTALWWVPFPDRLFDQCAEVAHQSTTTHRLGERHLFVQGGNIVGAKRLALHTKVRDRQIPVIFFDPKGSAKLEAVPPPLIVTCHGGPTGESRIGFDPLCHLLTSRGFAVIQVDFLGSTGYGRAYRDDLYGAWGRLDVADCCAAASILANSGQVDKGRMAIRGTSAGGMTALLALANTDAKGDGDKIRSPFCGAVVWYPVCDLATLGEATHDFETSYTRNLIGFDADQTSIKERSPIHQSSLITSPVLIFHGEQDQVVPIEQSKALIESLDARGIRSTICVFQNEGHGFKTQTNLVAAYEAELDFYDEIFSLAKRGV